MIYVFVFGIAIAIAALSLSTPPVSRGAGMLLAFMLLLFAGLRAGSTDYDQYQQLYELMRDSDNLEWPARLLIGKEPLFGLTMFSLVAVGANAQWLFFISAVLSVGVKWIAFDRILGETAVPLVLTLFGYFFLHDFTQIRAGIAVAFCFVSLGQLHAGRRGASIGWGLVAAAFHSSAVLYLLLSQVTTLPRRRAAWAMGAIVAITIAVAGTLALWLANLDERAAQQLEDSGTGIAPLVIAAIRLVVLLWLGRALRGRWPERESFLDACMLLCIASLPMLYGLRGLSSVMAFRFYELLDSFGVFLMSAAVLRGNASMRLAVLVLCVLSFVPLVRGGLLPSYDVVGF